jgi:large subunit ribosomal protein L18
MCGKKRVKQLRVNNFMDRTVIKRSTSRKRRVLRVRKKLQGTTHRPRLSVSKTNQHIYAHLIDDEKGVCLCGVGTKGQKLKKSLVNARMIGGLIAGLAKKHNIESVVFDRGRYRYHGLVAEVATGAREAGLQF